MHFNRSLPSCPTFVSHVEELFHADLGDLEVTPRKTHGLSAPSMCDSLLSSTQLSEGSTPW